MIHKGYNFHDIENIKLLHAIAKKTLLNVHHKNEMNTKI